MDYYFVMKPQKRGHGKYILLCFIAAFAASFLPQIGAGFFTFITVALFLGILKSHSIVVFENSLIEKDHRKRFVRKVSVQQIHCFRKNILGEIILYDSKGNKLLCAESNMSNFDRFEQWLAAHNIESK